MERNTKRIKLSSEDVTEIDEEVFNVNSLPLEILLQIFRYLNYQDLCRSGRVCKRWHELTKCPVLWKKVDIEFSLGKRSMYEVAKKFVQILPTCVTHLKLQFEYTRDWVLDIVQLFKKLHTNCPNLEVLVLRRAILPDNLEKGFNLGEEYLGNIRVLVLHNSLLKDMGLIFSHNKYNVTSKIEVLDISRSDGDYFTKSTCSLFHLKKLRVARMCLWDLFLKGDPKFVSRLEVLDIERTDSGSKTFRMIRDYGCHLVELYACFTEIIDDDLIFDKSRNFLPCLKIICLRGCNVTHKGISSLLKSCPSLQHVYVGEPYRDFSKCYSEKGEIIEGPTYCNHYSEIDYMCE